MTRSMIFLALEKFRILQMRKIRSRWDGGALYESSVRKLNSLTPARNIGTRFAKFLAFRHLKVRAGLSHTSGFFRLIFVKDCIGSAPAQRFLHQDHSLGLLDPAINNSSTSPPCGNLVDGLPHDCHLLFEEEEYFHTTSHYSPMGIALLSELQLQATNKK